MLRVPLPAAGEFSVRASSKETLRSCVYDHSRIFILRSGSVQGRAAVAAASCLYGQI